MREPIQIDRSPSHFSYNFLIQDYINIYFLVLLKKMLIVFLIRNNVPIFVELNIHCNQYISFFENNVIYSMPL